MSASTHLKEGGKEGGEGGYTEYLMMTASRITKKSTTILAFSPRWEITIPNPVQNTIMPDEGAKYNNFHSIIIILTKNICSLRR